LDYTTSSPDHTRSIIENSIFAESSQNELSKSCNPKSKTPPSHHSQAVSFKASLPKPKLEYTYWILVCERRYQITNKNYNNSNLDYSPITTVSRIPPTDLKLLFPIAITIFSRMQTDNIKIACFQLLLSTI